MKFTYSSYLKAKNVTALGSWILLYGQEQHLKRKALARLKVEVLAVGQGSAGADAPEAEATWEVLDGASLTARNLLGRAQTSGMFGGARGIVVLQADRIEKKKEQEELAKRLTPLPPDVTVILVTGEPKDRRDKGVKASLLKAFEEHKQGLAIDCPELRNAEATAWVIAYAKTLAKRLESAAAKKLVEQRIGVSLGKLASEIDKLASYAGESQTITSAHVEAVTPRLIEEEVFKLVEAVVAQRSGLAVSRLRTLLQARNERPERLLSLLASTVREIWQAKLLLDRGWRRGTELDTQTQDLLPRDPRKNLLKTLSGNRAWLLEKRLQHARAFSWPRLTRALLSLHSCDLVLKGISEKIEGKDVALELLVVQLCTDMAMPIWEL